MHFSDHREPGEAMVYRRLCFGDGKHSDATNGFNEWVLSGFAGVSRMRTGEDERPGEVLRASDVTLCLFDR